MPYLLSNAEGGDATASNLPVVLLCAAIVIVVAVLAFVPLVFSWKRRHRQTDAILATAVLWGAVAAGSVIYASLAQMNWAKERTLRIETGYFDPADTTGAPTKPWALWAALAVAYAAVLVWARFGKQRGDGTPPVPPL